MATIDMPMTTEELLVAMGHLLYEQSNWVNSGSGD
jgi:hypothetical protein